MTVVEVAVMVPAPLFQIPCEAAKLPPVIVLDVTVIVPVVLLYTP